MGLLPFTARFGVFARLEGTYAQTRDSFSVSGGNAMTSRSPQEWRANPKIGAGIQYLFTRHLAVRGDWERYRISETGHDHGIFDAWIVNLVFKMGGSAASTSVATPIAPAELDAR